VVTPPPPPDQRSRRPIETLENQARAFYQTGRLGEALHACRQLLSLEPRRLDVLAFAGTLAFKLGRHREAAELYQAALGLKPDHAEAHYNLGNALRELGQTEGAAAAYRRAAELRPDLGPAHYNLGFVLRAGGRLQEATQAYRRAAELMPDSPDVLRGLGSVLHEAGRLEEAAGAYRRALALRPEPETYKSLVGALLEQGDARGAVAVCDAWLELAPADVLALAVKCAALNELGDRERLRELLDFERFVQIRRIEPPARYASLAEFNQALARHVLEHPTLRVPPEDDPTYHHPSLYITDELLVEPKGPVADLERIIHAHIEDYRRAVAQGPAHVFTTHWPERWHLASWGVVLRGEGNLVPHVHLDGYLGGVCYVELPEVIHDPRASRAGWFELGRPPAELNLHAEPEVLPIQPEEGRMILFPGYFYHGTVPYRSAERRISIAFDLVPEE